MRWRAPLGMVAVLLCGAVAAAACAEDETGPGTAALGPPPAIELVEVGRLPGGGTALADRADDPHLYVTQKTGEIWVVDEVGAATPLKGADLTGEVSGDNEQGLLGITFSPGGEHLYLYFTDLVGDSVIIRYDMSGDGAVDPASRHEVFRLEQPHPGHNAGTLAFGPDGMFYVALGDGGQPLSYNAQDTSNLYGSLLRLDVTSDGVETYRVPPDNPFVGEEGRAPEIWVYGLRNPWKFSFDRDTGDVWIADVGNVLWEEVNRVPFEQAAGANFGWDVLEGFERNERSMYSTKPLPETVAPVQVHAHEDGFCAVIGGYVYRGSEIPGLVGRYVYTDYCRKQLLQLSPQPDGTWTGGPLAELPQNPWSMGEDREGNIYVISQRIQKIVPQVEPSGS